jgi:hypothetical protein
MKMNNLSKHMVPYLVYYYYPHNLEDGVGILAANIYTTQGQFHAAQNNSHTLAYKAPFSQFGFQDCEYMIL